MELIALSLSRYFVLDFVVCEEYTAVSVILEEQH